MFYIFHSGNKNAGVGCGTVCAVLASSAKLFIASIVFPVNKRVSKLIIIINVNEALLLI